MLPRPTLLLIVGAVTASRGAAATEFDLLSSSRVAEIAYRSPTGSRSERRPRRAPLLVPPADLGCADEFRGDELKIWSSTTRTTWHLLPPKLLGMGAFMDVVDVK